MAEWLEQVSQWHEMYFHDLEVMSSNPSWVELGVHTISVLSAYYFCPKWYLNQKYILMLYNWNPRE